MNFKLNLQEKAILANYCPNMSMETIFADTENSKTSKPHKFALDLSEKLDLRSSNNMLLFKTCLFITRGKI